jgi:hypothetical protein
MGLAAAAAVVETSPKSSFQRQASPKRTTMIALSSRRPTRHQGVHATSKRSQSEVKNKELRILKLNSCRSPRMKKRPWDLPPI